MSQAIIFIQWSNHAKVWFDHNNPTILAIAAIRHYNPTIPIFVYDTSDTLPDYGSYPELLNFSVVPWNHRYPIDYCPDWCVGNIYRCLARPFDLVDIARSLPYKELLYVDSDILWLCDPVVMFKNLHTHGIATTSINSGVVVYDVERAKPYFDEWHALIYSALAEDVVRAEQYKGYYGPLYTEEAAMCYLNRYSKHWQELPLTCNYQLYYREEPFDMEAINYHFISGRFGHDKSQGMLSVREFFGPIYSVLGDRVRDFGASTVSPGSLPLKKIGRLFHQ